MDKTFAYMFHLADKGPKFFTEMSFVLRYLIKSKDENKIAIACLPDKLKLPLKTSIFEYPAPYPLRRKLVTTVFSRGLN